MTDLSELDALDTAKGAYLGGTDGTLTIDLNSQLPLRYHKPHASSS